MTLYEIVRRFENLALALPNVRTASDGDVYAGLNDNPKLKYGVFFISQNTHQEYEQMDRYGLTLFYIDRLDDTLEDNRLQIQSIGKEILSTVIRDFCEEYDIDLPIMNYVPFTQKFKDLTAGVYVEITIEIYKDSCYDDFTEVPHSGCPDYEEGYEDGEEHQKSLLAVTAFTENGTYNRANGWKSVEVNVAQTGYTQEDLDNAYASGVTDQKNKLIALNVTENGQYDRADGYSAVTVNVPQTGSTINNQNKSISISANTSTTITYDSGYTGLGTVQIDVNVDDRYDEGFDDGFERGYQNGYTEGYSSGHTEGYDRGYDTGYRDGINYQKSLLTSTAFTVNDTYSRENGWSSVIVNVDQTGYTQEDLDAAYTSGYTIGYNDGYEVGLEECSGRYLGFEVISGGTIYWKHHNFDINTEDVYLTIEYSINGGEWNSVTSSGIGSGATIAELNAGDIIQFRGDNNAYHITTGQYGQDSYFQGNITCNVSGNIMSLINSTGYSTLTSLESDYTFQGLFGGTELLGDTSDNIKFVSAENLILPATTLTNRCYQGMFAGCTTLTKIPVLPAITLSEGCYQGMFAGCTSLINVPSLPATTLAGGCYHSMFSGCTSLVTAPVLPATTVANNCYQYMFAGCTSLPYAPALPATTLANNCYRDMFAGCTNLVTAPALPATTLVYACYYSMFKNCRNLINAPELPATTLADNCYAYMFQNCRNLVNGPSSIGTSATTMATSACTYMFNDCTSLINAPELPAATLASGCYWGMFWGCTNLNYIKCLATDISAPSCTYGWVSDVASNGTFLKATGMNDWTTGINGIPNNWTVIDV